MPKCSTIAATVRRVAAARAAAASLDVPSGRARSCRRARRDIAVVHVPPGPAGGLPPTPTVSPTAVPAATARRLCGSHGGGGDARLCARRLRRLRLLQQLRRRLRCHRHRGR
eukprot:3810405-Prymnesium_polylepis.1